jgi:hypothetical protein
MNKESKKKLIYIFATLNIILYFVPVYITYLSNLANDKTILDYFAPDAPVFDNPTAIILFLLYGLIIYYIATKEDNFNIKDLFRIINKTNKYLLLFYIILVVYGSTQSGQFCFFDNCPTGLEAIITKSILGFLVSGARFFTLIAYIYFVTAFYAITLKLKGYNYKLK